jgi:hypothetical protein
VDLVLREACLLRTILVDSCTLGELFAGKSCKMIGSQRCATCMCLLHDKVRARLLAPHPYDRHAWNGRYKIVLRIILSMPLEAEAIFESPLNPIFRATFFVHACGRAEARPNPMLHSDETTIRRTSQDCNRDPLL